MAPASAVAVHHTAVGCVAAGIGRIGISWPVITEMPGNVTRPPDGGLLAETELDGGDRARFRRDAVSTARQVFGPPDGLDGRLVEQLVSRALHDDFADLPVGAYGHSEVHVAFESRHARHIGIPRFDGPDPPRRHEDIG